MSSHSPQLSAQAKASLPTHVAIIMDGNGRWAKQRNLPRVEGHRHGAEPQRIYTLTRQLTQTLEVLNSADVLPFPVDDPEAAAKVNEELRRQWVMLGEIAATAQGLAWPYHLFRQKRPNLPTSKDPRTLPFFRASIVAIQAGIKARGQGPRGRPASGVTI